MKIIVLAKAEAKQDKIERVSQPELPLNDTKAESPTYKVWVKAQPVNGKSNEAITKLLAEYFKIPKTDVRLVIGRASKRKIFDITLKN